MASKNIAALRTMQNAAGDTPRSSRRASAMRAVFKQGRPPWYQVDGQRKEALVIGITGGSASGKTTVAYRIIEELGVPWVCLLSMDSFYKVLSEEELAQAHDNNFNFDSPDAFDLDLLAETLEDLKAGKQVEVPIYDFTLHKRSPNTVRMYGANVIIFEGILNFCTERLRDLMDVKIFVDEDADVRLARRLRRDIKERGRDIHGALKQYNKFVKPSFEQFIKPMMSYADLVVPRGAANKVALHLIFQLVRARLQERGFDYSVDILETRVDTTVRPANLHTLPNNNQLKGMHTIIRDVDATRDEFIFFSERIMRLLVEYATSYLPYRSITISDSNGKPYNGKRLDAKLCGVSIVRAGLTMEEPLRSVVPDAPLGKILIQSNEETHEPELHYINLPKNIKDYHVFVTDATVASGGAAMMAIRILLDHGVPENQIFLLTLVAALPGVHRVAYAFPDVTIVASEIDAEVDSRYFIMPGIGNFGNRYYGTEAD